MDDYVAELLSDKAEYLKNDDYVDNLYKKIGKSKKARPTISIVQFTDLHLDFDYAIGSNNMC